jgi:hypothetical protein
MKSNLVHSSEFVVRSLMLAVALILLPIITYAANNVYYSVGQNTNDHASGGNVSITGGVATFTVAQTATNLGVGDEVDYDTDNKKCYLVSKIDTSHWTVVTNTGATPNDTSGTKTLNSIKHCFSSLSAALPSGSGGAKTKLGTSDLTSGGGYILNIACYNDAGGYDGDLVIIDGWTTGPNNYIRVYTPTNTSTECNQRQRHNGKWDTGKYRLELDNWGSLIEIQEPYTRIDGLQLYALHNSAADPNIAAGNEARISNNILRRAVWVVDSEGIAFGDGKTVRIWNNIIYGNFDDGITNGWNAGDIAYIYNNTIYNCSDRGIYATAGTFIAKNNLIASTTNPYDGTFAAGTDYNATDINDTPGVGSNNRVNQTFAFVDAATNDFHLSAADSGAKDYGTPLSNDTNLAFSDDIDGQSRQGARIWDIGADEFIAKASLGKGVIRKAVIR